MGNREPVIGVSLFCDKSKELQRSHTINKTFFSELLKSCKTKNSAKVIGLSSNKVKIQMIIGQTDCCAAHVKVILINTLMHLAKMC